MTATILDGRALAKTLREELRADIHEFVAAAGAPPQLAVVQVAGDAASERYVRAIRKSCDDVGIAFVERVLPADTSQEALDATVAGLSDDARVSGVLLQMPLPKGLDAGRAIAKLDPRKDVDGVHPTSAGLLMHGQPCLVPNTPAGGMELLRRNDIQLAGK